MAQPELNAVVTHKIEHAPWAYDYQGCSRRLGVAGVHSRAVYGVGLAGVGAALFDFRA